MEKSYMTVNKGTSDSYLAVRCLICGEPIRLTDKEETELMYRCKTIIKICDKCKKAVLKMRDAEE